MFAIEPRPARLWLGAAASLALATLLGLVVAQLLLSPTGHDLRTLAAYLGLSGAVSLSLGLLGLRVADQAWRLSIQSKVFLAGLVGCTVGLVNVLVVARLMFFSNVHDLRLLIALLIFSGTLTLFFSSWVAARTTGRIVSAAAQIRSLAAGEYASSVAISGRDEAAELGQTVNELAARLRSAERERAALERERRELTAAASHDLRTPLSSLRAMVDALEDGVVDDPREVRRYHVTMGRELDRLSRMIDDLFLLAQVEAGPVRLDGNPTAVQDIAAEVVDAMHAESQRLGVHLSLSVLGAPPQIELDGARIERALSNLVRNALEHTPTGGSVAVEVHREDRWVATLVSDTGVGIDPVHLTKIWDRFYRVEHSRVRDARSASGAGLGLAIVRGVAEAHGGSVQASSVPGEGSKFTLRLPLQPPPGRPPS